MSGEVVPSRARPFHEVVDGDENIQGTVVMGGVEAHVTRGESQTPVNERVTRCSVKDQRVA